MFRPRGPKRSFRDNISLAIMLCMTAGFINAAGFFAFSVLTTNVTGHAALLAVNIASPRTKIAEMAGVWLILFLAGAIAGGIMVSGKRINRHTAYVLPILIIISMILFVAVFGHLYKHRLAQTEYFAGILLFAMGMQNALVTIISGALVRSTHLTGMFTDLGIDLSLYLTAHKKTGIELRKRILLRFSIILFFLTGGILGAWSYLRWSFHAFYIPAGILAAALLYNYKRNKRKLMQVRVQRRPVKKT